MWIFRSMMFLGEYGAILLSLIASIIAYLLNLNATDLAATSRFRVWLRKWVEFRNRQVKKSSLIKTVISILTLIAAFALTPFINRLFVGVSNLWSKVITDYPYEALRIAVVFGLFLLAWGLFSIRKRLPRVYAFVEIAIGLAMAWDALRFVHRPDAVSDGQMGVYWTGKLFSPDALRVMAAVYVIIRGLVNWNEKKGPKQAELGEIKTAKKAVDFGLPHQEQDSNAEKTDAL